jgi:hypothetical protein
MNACFCEEAIISEGKVKWMTPDSKYIWKFFFNENEHENWIIKNIKIKKNEKEKKKC